VFDFKGRLIGVGSSAAGHRRFNRFGVIDQLHANMEFLKTPGNKRGTFDKGPGGKAGYDHKFTNEDVEKLQTLLQTRLQQQHQQTSLFVKKRITGENSASITANDLVNFFYLDGLAVADGRKFSYGLDDPELLKPLVKAVKSSEARLAMQVGGSPAGFALRVGKTQLVTADEKLGDANAKPVTLKLPDGSNIDAKIARRDAATGLAILEIPAETKSPILDLTKSKDNLASGDLLVAVDVDSVLGLGNAMDQARPIGAPDSEGPVGEDMPLNKRRGNFPMVVTHSLPLYATDTGTPVHTLDGTFAGIHLARATRTYGVLIQPKELREFLENK
jgi:hypothetical protein